MNPQIATSSSPVNIPLVLVFLITAQSWAQPSATGSLPPATTPAIRQVEALQNKWKKVSAVELLKAAEGGEAEAQFYWGMAEWQAAWGDNNRSFSWTLKALANGQNLTESEQTASRDKWGQAPEDDLRHAAESGDRGAQWFLGRLESDHAFARGRKAFDWMKKAAERFLAPAQFEVALRYLDQTDWVCIPVDVPEGLKWLERAADQHWEPAEHKFADVLLTGELIQPNLSHAIHFLQQAAAQNCPRAQYELARQYAQGNGEPGGTGESSVALLRKSAANGFVPALVALGDRYRTGLGVEMDLIRAVRCYEAARNSPTRFGLGQFEQAAPILEIVGDDLEPKLPVDRGYASFAIVLSTYLKATKKAEPAAMCRLGEWYLSARFAPKDSVQAYHWFHQAALGGNANAARQCDSLKSALTTEEVDRASGPSFNPPL